MKDRYYPIKESDFIREIEPHIIRHYRRPQGAVCPGLHTEEDRERYKTRSAIERFFGRIKENKRLALRFDKLDITFFSFFAIACLKVFKLLC